MWRLLRFTIQCWHLLLTCRWAKLPQGAVKRERDYHSWAEYAPQRHKDTDNDKDTDKDKHTDNIKEKHNERIGSEGAPGYRKRQTDTKPQVQKAEQRKENKERREGGEDLFSEVVSLFFLFTCHPLFCVCQFNNTCLLSNVNCLLTDLHEKVLRTRNTCQVKVSQNLFSIFVIFCDCDIPLMHSSRKNTKKS